jgi:hypothetical protein
MHASTRLASSWGGVARDDRAGMHAPRSSNTGAVERRLAWNLTWNLT